MEADPCAHVRAAGGLGEVEVVGIDYTGEGPMGVVIRSP